ncbi:hypothetical protein H0H81_000519 [Sphagnurus paluster]|uniref:PIH1 N-terminal domain-containing protein n=1 Tax=Sphagnurus paluster TaxID=117069 RepID=A0A9P7GHI7_9AGAR|nr:hypothetical protein H0H81_000519 [Sphagnurus paluster]
MSNSKKPVTLTPRAGFCVKTTTLQPARAIPVGLKVFVNIAYDDNVPAPPPASEDTIRRAMNGEEDTWFVPVVVSDGRQDKDKSGKPSLVFDCVFHTSVRPRTLTEPEYKLFIVELGLQRIEAQSTLVLSRHIATPNIASKGKLAPRTVLIPDFLAPSPSSPSSSFTATPQAKPKPLIQELPKNEDEIASSAAAATDALIQELEAPKPKGILKTPTSALPAPAPALPIGPPLSWTWVLSEGTKDRKIEIRIRVPNLTRAQISQATLDVEPRRFILSLPPSAPSTSSSPSATALTNTLDVDLTRSDAELVALAGSSPSSDSGATNALTLKRQRALDVAGARAEWRLGEGMLVLFV